MEYTQVCATFVIVTTLARLKIPFPLDGVPTDRLGKSTTNGLYRKATPVRPIMTSRRDLTIM